MAVINKEELDAALAVLEDNGFTRTAGKAVLVAILEAVAPDKLLQSYELESAYKTVAAGYRLDSMYNYFRNAAGIELQCPEIWNLDFKMTKTKEEMEKIAKFMLADVDAEQL